jgi:hypothetical protein
VEEKKNQAINGKSKLRWTLLSQLDRRNEQLSNFAIRVRSFNLNGGVIKRNWSSVVTWLTFDFSSLQDEVQSDWEPELLAVVSAAALSVGGAGPIGQLFLVPINAVSMFDRPMHQPQRLLRRTQRLRRQFRWTTALHA